MTDLRLSFACERYDRVEAIANESVKPEGIDLVYSRSPVAETFYRQLKYHEFDVSEMSISFYLMAKARQNFPYLAIPIFPMRRFFHTELLCNVDSGIKRPEDIVGKRVGLPEYGMTLGLWVRGILLHEFGIPADKIEWYVERTEKSIGAALGFRAPSNVKVQDVPPNESLVSMLSKGQVDVGFVYYEQMKSYMEKSTTAVLSTSKVKRLFPDRKAEAKRYFKKTGFFPINHVIIVRKELVDANPWIATNLFNAFVRSKQICFEINKKKTEMPHSFVWLEDLYDEINEVFGDDPFPYGFKANSKILDAMTTYSNEQGLTPRKLEPAELFFPNTIDL